ncbi:MAG: efflux RND transporter periplasmic adaptor subunit [Vicinamibacterales bacterium]
MTREPASLLSPPSPRPHSRVARRHLAVLATVSLSTLLGCQAPPSPEAHQSPTPVVVTGQAVRRTMPLTVPAIGHVEPIARLAVKARVGGELAHVWFVAGQNVTLGTTLFTIDPRPHEIALREAEARLARDEVALEQAVRDAARNEDLIRARIISPSEYERTSTNLASLRASVDADRVAVEGARLQLSYCTITAPLSGRTGDLLVTAGNLVKANDDNALVTINQLTPIHVAFSLPAHLLPSVQEGFARGLEVTALRPNDTRTRFVGRLAFLDNVVDKSTSTVLLKAVFDNRTEALWPGQFVDVVLKLGEETDRVVVPSTSVQRGQQGDYVVVVTERSTAELRPVHVNRMDERDAVIDAGLNGGETVVVSGHLRVVPDGPVSVRADATRAP